MMNSPNSNKNRKKPDSRDQEVARQQKTGIGAQYPRHTQSTGEYPRQQTGRAAPASTDDKRMRCPRCGMERSGWTGFDGNGVEIQGRVYCCEGCADDKPCLCIDESKRHTGANIGEEREV
jgi:hypothetical protein